MSVPVSTKAPLDHYIWGDQCDGWVLTDTATLSVKQERMPAGTAEILHYHQHAQQFFYILNGEATFEIEGDRHIVRPREGIYIAAGLRHRIMNQSAEVLEFILSSQPSTTGDRFIISEDANS